MTEENNPIISHTELVEILQLLLCHALHNDLRSLSSKITSTFPEMLTAETSTPYRQLTVFSSFFTKFLRVGPLPDICHYKFLNTLHNGVIGMVKQNSQVFHPMPISDLIKLVSGIRCLLGRAVIMEEKFVVKDIETFISKYLPTLPVTPENIKAWESLGEVLQFNVKQTNNPKMKIISTVNDRSVKYLKEKLTNLSQERARSTSEIEASFLSLWRSIEDKLIIFMQKIKLCLEQNIFEILIEHKNVKLKLLSRGLSRGSSEEELIAFIDHLMNVFIESQFWTSDLIRKHLLLAGYNK